MSLRSLKKRALPKTEVHYGYFSSAPKYISAWYNPKVFCHVTNRKEYGSTDSCTERYCRRD